MLAPLISLQTIVCLAMCEPVQNHMLLVSDGLPDWKIAISSTIIGQEKSMLMLMPCPEFLETKHLTLKWSSP